MLEQWLKFWRQWMFWWLPGGDEPETAKPAHKPKEPAARATTLDTPAAEVDAGTTRQPEPDAHTPSETRADDLTVIHGIGPAIARKLDTLGVKTLADLAAADPEDLATKVARRPVTPNRVQEWIAEAKKRVS